MKRSVQTASLLILVSFVVSACALDHPTPEEVQQTVGPKSESIITSENQIESITTEPPAEITETDEPVKYIPDQYYEVIDSIVAYVNNYNPDNMGDYIGMGEISGIHEICIDEDPLNEMGFTFVDIDNDAVSELLVVDCTDGIFLHRIIEMYTFYDGEVHHVVSGWARNRYYLLNDMTIYHEGSGGAANNVISTYNLSSESHELVLIESYYTDLDIDGIVHTYNEACISLTDIDNPDIELIENDPDISFYDRFSRDESDMFIFDNITTLVEYCG